MPVPAPRPAVGSSAGPHGAIVAAYGPRPPAPRPGFAVVGTGRGGWIYRPVAPARPGRAAPAPNPNAVNLGIVPANSPLLNPNAPLSGQSLLQAAQGLAKAQTQAPIDQLSAQIAQNNRQAQGAIDQVGGIYKSLGNFANQGVTDEKGFANDLNTQLGNIGSQEQSQLQGIGQNAQSSLLKYAPQSDQSNSLASPALQALTAEIARQQGLAAQDQSAFRAFGAAQGGNYEGAAARNLGVFSLEGQEGLRNIAQNAQARNMPLESKIASLRGMYGADLASAIGKLRQQEIANNISQTGLGIRAQANLINQANNLRTTQTSTANNIRTTQTSTANNIRDNQTRQLVASMHNTATRGGGSRGGGSGGSGGRGGGSGGTATPAQQRQIFDRIDKVIGEFNNLVQHGVPPAQAYHLLQNGGTVQTGSGHIRYGANPYGTEILNAAFNARPGGAGLSPGDIHWLHSLGIVIGNRYPLGSATGNAVGQGGAGLGGGGF